MGNTDDITVMWARIERMTKERDYLRAEVAKLAEWQREMVKNLRVLNDWIEARHLRATGDWGDGFDTEPSWYSGLRDLIARAEPRKEEWNVWTIEE